MTPDRHDNSERGTRCPEASTRTQIDCKLFSSQVRATQYCLSIRSIKTTLYCLKAATRAKGDRAPCKILLQSLICRALLPRVTRGKRARQISDCNKILLIPGQQILSSLREQNEEKNQKERKTNERKRRKHKR